MSKVPFSGVPCYLSCRKVPHSLQEPEAKAKGRVPRPPESKEDPYAFFVPAVVFFLYLGFGTIYSAETLGFHLDSLGFLFGA